MEDTLIVLEKDKKTLVLIQGKGAEDSINRLKLKLEEMEEYTVEVYSSLESYTWMQNHKKLPRELCNLPIPASRRSEGEVEELWSQLDRVMFDPGRFVAIVGGFDHMPASVRFGHANYQFRALEGHVAKNPPKAAAARGINQYGMPTRRGKGR